MLMVWFGGSSGLPQLVDSNSSGMIWIISSQKGLGRLRSSIIRRHLSNSIGWVKLLLNNDSRCVSICKKGIF